MDGKIEKNIEKIKEKIDDLIKISAKMRSLTEDYIYYDARYLADDVIKYLNLVDEILLYTSKIVEEILVKR